jgi:hypothetical protein
MKKFRNPHDDERLILGTPQKFGLEVSGLSPMVSTAANLLHAETIASEVRPSNPNFHFENAAATQKPRKFTLKNRSPLANF